MTQVNMAMAGSELGGPFQWVLPPTVHGILVANTVAASGQVQSNIIAHGGYQKGAVGVTSTQAGAINVQRYLDTAGLIPVGAVLTAALTASTPQWLTWVDGLPSLSFRVTITNTGGSVATLSNLAIVSQSG